MIDPGANGHGNGHGPPDPLGLYRPGAASPPPLGRAVGLAAVLRYRWMILGVFALVSVTAITAIWSLTVPVYRANGQVRVRPIVPRILYQTEQSGIIPLYQSHFNTQVAVIRGPDVLQAALDQPDVQQTQWFQDPPKPVLGGSLSALERLQKALSVEPRGTTEVIDVAVSTRRPQDAAIIVNAILDQYMRAVEESASRTDERIFEELQRLYRSLQNEINALEATADRQRRELLTVNADDLISQTRERLAETEAQLRELDRRIEVARHQQKALEDLLAGSSGTAEAPASQPINRTLYETDPDWRGLYIRYRQTQAALAAAKHRFGESHPALEGLQAEADLAGEILRDREHQIEALVAAGTLSVGTAEPGARPSPAVLLESLKQQIQQLEYQRAVLAEHYNEDATRFRQMFDSSQALARQMREIDRKRSEFNIVQSRLRAWETERNAPAAITVLARAVPPSEPYRDRRILYSVLSVIAGLAAGMALAFFRASLSESIHEAGDLPLAGRAPFLGHLPLLRRTRDASDLEEHPMLSECIRMVRTALLERIARKPGSVVLVTSAAPGEGKTTISTMLARSLAQCGKRVLLVDADLRSPSVAQRLGVDARGGLVGCLVGPACDADAVVASGTPRLDVLPAGDVQETDPEILANGAFSARLEEWRARYDVILLDSPPVLPVADARILSRYADGTIMVVREGIVRRGDLIDALACLGTAGARILGTVFIGSSGHSAYGAGSYGDYYGSRGDTRRLAART